MAIPNPATEVHDTPNKSIRQNVPRRGCVLHHGALTSYEYLLQLEMGAKQVSSTLIVKDARRGQMMSYDLYRAWSLSDAYWDSALRSMETCNESTNGWTVSEASHRSLALVVAYFAIRDGFWPHRDGDPKTWTVLGHREVYTIHGGSYGTACPGGMDLDLVTKWAQDILNGVSAAIESAIEGIEMGIYIQPGSGLLFFNDELGIDAVTTYVDPGMNNDEVVDAVQRAWGKYTDAFSGNGRLESVAHAIGERRWAAKRREIAEETLLALKPLLEAIKAPEIPQEALDAAVAKALDGLRPDPVDYERLEGAIGRVDDEVLARLGEKLAP